MSQQHKLTFCGIRTRLQYLAAALLLAAILVLAAGCTNSGISSAFPEPNTNIVPKSGTQVALFEAGTLFDEVSPESLITNRPLVTIPSQYIPHQTLMINLDADEFDEQIIVVKMRNDPEDLIWLIVADYDSVRSNYYISWTGATRSSNLRALTIYADELTANLVPEIVAFGLNAAGEQTLDVFELTSTNTLFGLRYRRVLSVVADIGIEIVAAPQNYTNLAIKGVKVTTRDLSSENDRDTIESIYVWRPADQQFLLLSSEKISGSSIAQSQLSDLFSSNEAVFLNYLRGPWILNTRTSSDNPQENFILYIDPELRTLALYRPGRVLSYRWQSSNKSPYGGRITFNLINEVIPANKIWLTVNLTGLDSLTMSSSSATEVSAQWDGNYTRLTTTRQDEQIQIRGQKLAIHSLELSGLYRSSDGSELFFSSPSLTLRTREGEETAGYAVFRYGNVHVLQILFLNPNGTVSRERNFLASLETEESDRLIKRLLTLEPISLLASGITPQGGIRMEFEQRIILQE